MNHLNITKPCFVKLVDFMSEAIPVSDDISCFLNKDTVKKLKGKYKVCKKKHLKVPFTKKKNNGANYKASFSSKKLNSKNYPFNNQGTDNLFKKVGSKTKYSFKKQNIMKMSNKSIAVINNPKLFKTTKSMKSDTQSLTHSCSVSLLRLPIDENLVTQVRVNKSHPNQTDVQIDMCKSFISSNSSNLLKENQSENIIPHTKLGIATKSKQNKIPEVKHKKLSPTKNNDKEFVSERTSAIYQVRIQKVDSLIQKEAQSQSNIKITDCHVVLERPRKDFDIKQTHVQGKSSSMTQMVSCTKGVSKIVSADTQKRKCSVKLQDQSRSKKQCYDTENIRKKQCQKVKDRPSKLNAVAHKIPEKLDHVAQNCNKDSHVVQDSIEKHCHVALERLPEVQCGDGSFNLKKIETHVSSNSLLKRNIENGANLVAFKSNDDCPLVEKKLVSFSDDNVVSNSNNGKITAYFKKSTKSNTVSKRNDSSFSNEAKNIYKSAKKQEIIREGNEKPYEIVCNTNANLISCAVSKNTKLNIPKENHKSETKSNDKQTFSNSKQEFLIQSITKNECTFLKKVEKGRASNSANSFHVENSLENIHAKNAGKDYKDMADTMSKIDKHCHVSLKRIKHDASAVGTNVRDESETLAFREVEKHCHVLLSRVEYENSADRSLLRDESKPKLPKLRKVDKHCHVVLKRLKKEDFKMFNLVQNLPRSNFNDYKSKPFVKTITKGGIINENKNFSSTSVARGITYANHVKNNSRNEKLGGNESPEMEFSFNAKSLTKKQKSNNSIVKQILIPKKLGMKTAKIHCLQCLKSFPKSADLSEHICSGKKKKGFLCIFCKKIFPTTKLLSKHKLYHLYAFNSSKLK